MTALIFRPPHSASHFEKGGKGGPQRNFVITRSGYMPRNGKNLGAAIVWFTQLQKASPPLRMIQGTQAKVSVLLMVVGLPYSP